jgi:hypothetical protein
MQSPPVQTLDAQSVALSSQVVPSVTAVLAHAPKPSHA